ncbi:NAD(P)H-binding protein [Mangrovicoccus algicola]|uniref:NAD(P)H-binding protein n=1 Tax=Mangrovicoccus algicola TaxID=2771008 RepID=A0A8J6YX57_9RHOB|nr:NAD(P)H-binding protein [Mangrovicoccus algicola]MBE3639362.1 NAD(P)H-binding protein [Mangrovicoccus algicola]
MSRIFVFGATGGIGRRLCLRLVASGHRVSGLHRAPEQAEALREAGVVPVAGDLMALGVPEMTRLLQNHDIAVFSAGAAGSGADRTRTIDGEGPAKLAEAAQAAGVGRVYLVSAFPEAGRGREPKEGFELYMRTKKEADAALAASPLDWVILRPGTLLHEEGGGRVALGPALTYGSVARGNVARVLAGLIDRPGIRRRVLELTDGATPVIEALAALDP